LPDLHKNGDGPILLERSVKHEMQMGPFGVEIIPRISSDSVILRTCVTLEGTLPPLPFPKFAAIDKCARYIYEHMEHFFILHLEEMVQKKNISNKRNTSCRVDSNNQINK
jgi:hypothetical protein